MSRADQGRRHRAWVGSGAAEDAGSRGLDAGDFASAVGEAAAEAMGGVQGRAFRRMLADGGAKDLTVALPVWASVATMEAGRFRALVVGPGFSPGAAASLQIAARAVADAGDCRPVRVARAGAAVAAAFGRMREAGWGYALNYAADKAAYALGTAEVSFVDMSDVDPIGGTSESPSSFKSMPNDALD